MTRSEKRGEKQREIIKLQRELRSLRQEIDPCTVERKQIRELEVKTGKMIQELDAM